MSKAVERHLWRNIVISAVPVAIAGLILAACAAPNTGTSGGTTTGTATGTAPGAATGTPGSPNQAVAGDITFRSSSALPSDAMLSVAVVDNSSPEHMVLGQTNTAVGGKNAPLQFEVPYDLNQVNATDLYSVQATVTAGGKAIWVPKGNVLVITQGRPTTGVAVPMKQP